MKTIVEKALAELTRWENEKPRRDKDEKLFYCPVCTYKSTKTYYMLKKEGRPKCPVCGVEMADFDETKFRELRRRLAEEARKILPHVVEALMEVAKEHGVVGDGPEVEVAGAVAVVRPDHTPNEFRYDASKRRLEAFYYYYDMAGHERSLKELAAAARRLNLGLHVAIYPGHAKMPIPFPYTYNAFNGFVIEMNSDELRGYMMATSYWL
jgi:transposase-like protein